MYRLIFLQMYKRRITRHTRQKWCIVNVLKLIFFLRSIWFFLQNYDTKWFISSQLGPNRRRALTSTMRSNNLFFLKVYISNWLSEHIIYHQKYWRQWRASPRVIYISYEVLVTTFIITFTLSSGLVAQKVVLKGVLRIRVVLVSSKIQYSLHSCTVLCTVQRHTMTPD